MLRDNVYHLRDRCYHQLTCEGMTDWRRAQVVSRIKKEKKGMLNVERLSGQFEGEKDLYTIHNVDAELLVTFQDQARKQIKEYEKSIADHSLQCAEVCKLSKGDDQTCDEDLMFLYGAVGRLYQFLFAAQECFER